MLTYEQALEALLAAAQPLIRVETVDSHLALGRILAEPIVSAINVPSADNSAMDGYAFCLEDYVQSGGHLEVAMRIPAGQAPGLLPVGKAARIFTGAPIPTGANVVVMQERCQEVDGWLQVDAIPRPGENIRRAGEDIAQGSQILPVGTRLGPAQLGLIASVGIAAVQVQASMRVAVFFTGDELVAPGLPLRPGAIYNSNRHVLHGMLRAQGCEISDLGIIPDDLEATRQALRKAAEGNDLIITSGGVSVGEEDHVKRALQAEGALETWKVAIRPGKPFAFGRVADTPFIGLPGNPVSGFVTFLALALPYLRKRQGRKDVLPSPIGLRADFEWRRASLMREFLRVRRNAQGGLDLFPSQGSGVLNSCVWADGLAVIAPEHVVEKGDLVNYIPFGELL
jgi:molybdopterin molybdotransferase